MSLRLTKRGQIWYVRGTVAKQSIYETTATSDRSEAEAYKATREARLWKRSVFGERTTRTFGEAAVVYLEGRTIGPSYRATLRPIIKRFKAWPLSDVTQSAVDDYISFRHSGAAAGTIVRAVITPVTAIMNTAAKRGWCDRPSFDRPRPSKPSLRWLTEDEAGILLEASAGHLRPLLVFLLHTGARLGEALRLEWGDVDLTERRARLIRTKNGESRGIPLNDAAWTALANLEHREGCVFLTPRGKPYYDSGGRGGSPIKTAFKGACRKAGLENVRVHDLRHTFASWLVMKGVPLRTVAELLGHKTLSMVMRYAHLSPEHLHDAVQKLDGIGAKSVQGKNKAG